MLCPYCKEEIQNDAIKCKHCGSMLTGDVTTQGQAPAQNHGRSKIAAGLLGIFLGGFGVHKFYLGQIVWGIIYLLLCWTMIPAIVGFIEGIIYLTMSDEAFSRKYDNN